MKHFNTTGTCFPDKHYMVDITDRLECIKDIIDRGDYFCINRGRQYGKTTTLNGLRRRFQDVYSIFSISFEGQSNRVFERPESIFAMFLSKMYHAVKFGAVRGLTEDVECLIAEYVERYAGELPEEVFTEFVQLITSWNPRPIVVIIDEVDQAGNYDAFLNFLGVLRNQYLHRDVYPTFQSVILAGVYDIKNLKLKIRQGDEHQYNSPWNIAVPFTYDMSLHADGIAGMLSDYKQEHGLAFDEKRIAQMLYDYTSGYPFLVSRLCQITHQKHYPWDKEGILQAVNDLLKEPNTLFDDMVKKLNDYPNLAQMLKRILYSGMRIPYNYYEQSINIATMFSYVKEENGALAVHCRIFETWLYNYFLSEERNADIYKEGEIEKNQFVHNGYIDMRHMLERFVVHMNEIYHPHTDSKFLEENGRKVFLTYIRPIINGTGHYYCEARTRDMTRTDIVIDYCGQQYVIELKIWRGNSYNERGEKQLSDYLDFYGLNTGYLVSFCFNKNKQSGVREVTVGNKKIYEAIV